MLGGPREPRHPEIGLWYLSCGPTPLPCLQHLNDHERHAHCRRVVGEMRARAEAENREQGRAPMGVAAILAQDSHGKPVSTDRSPAPFGHATHDSTVAEFRTAHRAGGERRRDRALELAELFPL
jgi:hypothetical protein